MTIIGFQRKVIRARGRRLYLANVSDVPTVQSFELHFIDYSIPFQKFVALTLAMLALAIRPDLLLLSLHTVPVFRLEFARR